MRATATLSGPMLKFWIVWWMSWVGEIGLLVFSGGLLFWASGMMGLVLQLLDPLREAS